MASAISSKTRLISPGPRSGSSPVGAPRRWKSSIEDDGPGFSAEVIGRLGEPYVTTKKDRRAKSEEDSGLGLGLFIAKTLLERSGAAVILNNLAAPQSGARITIRWPRASFEPGRRGRGAEEPIKSMFSG